MVLIIGGAYQGKLTYAKAVYDLSDEEVFTCTDDGIDFSKRCIYHIEDFVWSNPNALEYFQSHREDWKDSILICQDIFCGVVPMDPNNRVWRQTTGRLCQYLSREAQQVSRIFCGLEQRLK